VTSFDSGAVFLVKALFYPVTAVGSLALCLWVAGRPYTGAHFLIGVLTFAGTAEFLGDARIDRNRPAPHELAWLWDILVRWLTICACVSLLLYLAGIDIVLTDPALIAWTAITPFVLWIGAIKVRQLLIWVGLHAKKPRTAVIVGINEQALVLSRMLQHQPLLGIQLLGFFEDRRVRNRQPEPPGSVLGRMADVAAFVSQHGVNVVYITLPISPRPGLARLLRALRDTVASVYFVPDLHALNDIQARVDVVHGIPMFAVYASPFFGVRPLAKRASDLLLSGLALLCLSPLLITVGIVVKLSSDGPVIFRQRRYGLDGREIMVYKFRSMTVTEDGAGTYTQVKRADSRVTPFGAFMRRTSLDELPQLLIPSYMLRHKVKPGITGWAQVNGFRGGDDLRSMRKRIEFDLHYLKNWSIWFDLRIMLRTFSLIWGDRDAY
jgi:putative colanic acid biosynthesis UDP-glucose lipid carrier transferase